MIVRWREFKNYAGPVIIGEHSVKQPTGGRAKQHLVRARYLTTQVETGGSYGTVVMYDGTTVTASPDQFILTYPRELANEDWNALDDQGGLVKLLAEILAIRLVNAPTLQPALDDLRSEMERYGWYVHESGSIRYIGDSERRIDTKTVLAKADTNVFGYELRDEITPNAGRVPSKGPMWDRASRWAMLFARVFGDPATFDTQDVFGERHAATAYRTRKLIDTTIQQQIFAGSAEKIRVGDIGEALDLAMCVWYSNSVNAPAKALEILRAVYTEVGTGEGPVVFAKALVHRLGTSSYGRWNASDPNGRYQRTRRLAMQSGLWGAWAFNQRTGIMPPKL